MAPKRKATTSDKNKTPKHAHIVKDVVDKLKPFIQQAVKDAVDDSKTNPSSSASVPVDVIGPDANVSNASDNSVFGDNATTLLPSPGETNPIFLHVPPTTIAKIQDGKYVALSELLKSDERDISFNISNTGNVTVNKRSKAIKITSCEQWFNAFLIYAAIYVEQFLADSKQLFKYMACVQGMFKSFGVEAAVKYDEDFRKMKELNPAHRWDTVHQEIYLLAAARPVNTRNTNTKPQSDQLFRRANPCPIGYCRQFNATAACTYPKCAFKHACFKCEGDHASTGCRVAMQQQPTLSAKQAAVTKSIKQQPTNTN